LRQTLQFNGTYGKHVLTVWWTLWNYYKIVPPYGNSSRFNFLLVCNNSTFLYIRNFLLPKLLQSLILSWSVQTFLLDNT
jgi:hypothetical protein